MALPSVTSKIESAFASLLGSVSLGSGVTMYEGDDFREQIWPCVVCNATHGPEMPILSGNYMVRVDISIRSTADQKTTEDPSAVQDLIVSNVLELLKWDNLGAQLNARGVTGIFVYDPVIDRGLTSQPIGDGFSDTISLDCLCMAI